MRPENMVYTQKEIKRMLMPTVGTDINGYKVVYVNLGKLRFTATYDSVPPEINYDIIQEDKVYTVQYIDGKNKRFTATLSDVIQKVPEVSDEMNTDEVTKLE